MRRVDTPRDLVEEADRQLQIIIKRLEYLQGLILEAHMKYEAMHFSKYGCFSSKTLRRRDRKAAANAVFLNYMRYKVAPQLGALSGDVKQVRASILKEAETRIRYKRRARRYAAEEVEEV